MLSALSHSPDPTFGHEVREEIYRDPGEPVTGVYTFQSRHYGRFEDGCVSNIMDIHYTMWGTEGIPVVFLHGVPTNRRQYYPIQRRVASFCRTLSFDMLGMGESSKPRDYGRINATGCQLSGDTDAWKWDDHEYIYPMLQEIFGGEKVVFMADDWGAGVAIKYAERYPETLHALVLMDPIAFDGYPVAEIQAIGRASQLPDDKFREAMGAFDQTVVQIFKTMVYDPNVFNQYNLRDLKFPYVDVDYDRLQPPATSLSLKLHYHNIRVLADRSAILSPSLLLPYDKIHNPQGVDYSKINIPVLVLWGEYDNMMPQTQQYRFLWVLHQAPQVQLIKVPRAGHFAGVDQPKFVAESLLNFIGGTLGLDYLADIFLGFEGIWKGDEVMLIDDLRELRKRPYSHLQEPTCPMSSSPAFSEEHINTRLLRELLAEL